jgi:hypothetical protein
LGGLVAGPVGAVIGAWLVSGVAGAVGGAIGRFVTGLVDTFGRAVAGLFGIDFHSNGTTPGGGTWNRTDYGHGGWERHERGQSFDVDEMMGADGSFSQDITGKSAHSGYNHISKTMGKEIATSRRSIRPGYSTMETQMRMVLPGGVQVIMIRTKAT